MESTCYYPRKKRIYAGVFLFQKIRTQSPTERYLWQRTAGDDGDDMSLLCTAWAETMSLLERAE